MTALAVVAVLSALVATAATPRNDFHVVVNKRIGPYASYLTGRYPAAVKAFDAPTLTGTVKDSNVCTVSWTRLGLRMRFAIDLNPCAHLRRAAWYGATFTTGKWVVGRGIRVGDPIAKVRRLYPKAKLDAATATWTLRSAPGDGGPVPVLTASAPTGKVTAINVYTGTVF